VPIGVTTPVVGTRVGSISTGTPFVHPETYQQFDPEVLLGMPPRVMLTHLASNRVVRAVAAELGHELDRSQTTVALTWVKDRVYRSGQAVVPHEQFADFLAGLCTPGRAQ
jgi:2-isopropylmalate synthase